MASTGTAKQTAGTKPSRRLPEPSPKREARRKVRANAKAVGKEREMPGARETPLVIKGTDDGNGKKGRLDLSSLDEQLKSISHDIASARASGGALLCLSISVVQRRLIFQDVGAVERVRVAIGVDPGARAWSPRCQRKKEVRSTSSSTLRVCAETPKSTWFSSENLCWLFASWLITTTMSAS